MIHYSCEHNVVNQLEEDAFTDQEAEDYINLVWLGIISTTSLSPSYNLRIKSILTRAVEEGFGSTLSSLPPSSIEYRLLSAMTDNISSFAAAKQYQQVRDMETFLTISRTEFFAEAFDIFDNYNKNWLATEFDTAINAAQSGRDWIGFEKNADILPMLTYQTQQDGKVRPEHQTLQGVTRPVSDPFWDSWTPPNGWNCRCFLTSSADAIRTPSKDIKLNKLENEIPEMFRFNPGKTGMIFSGLHPYFDIRRGDAALKRQNFNLPV